MKNLDLKIILRDLKGVQFVDDNSYVATYLEFVEYFTRMKPGDIDEHTLIIASNFVYGWMPTILHLDLNKKDMVLKILNAALDGQRLDAINLQTCQKAINGSLIGLSKLLHFINPQQYAIWDSRVFRYMTEKKSTYGINKPQNYLDYLDGVHTIAKQKGYEKLKRKIEKVFKYEAPATRVIEFAMFSIDRHRQQLAKQQK